MSIDLDDPFMAGHEPVERRPGDFKRNSQGTPQVSDPSGDTVKSGKRKGEIKWASYSRPSGFGKIVEDMYSIHKWDQRQNVYGFAMEPALVERAKILTEIEDRDSKQWKDEADKIIKAAKLVAKASISADRGSHTHGLAEDDDEGRDIIARIEDGEQLGMPVEVQRSLVAAWREMLTREGLEILAVEMPVVNDIYRAAGTLDRIARLTRPLRFRLVTGEIIEIPAGTVVILDIKTGKRRLNPNGTVMYWQGYAVQVFLYGPTSRPYDTATDTRGEWQWEIDGHWALIAHLDVLGALDGKPSCDLILVDLEAGWRAADLCVAAKAWAADQTVFSVAQLEVLSEQGPPQLVDPQPSFASSDSTHSVNDLLPRDGMPQHALDELECDRLNDARRASYADWGTKHSPAVEGPLQTAATAGDGDAPAAPAAPANLAPGQDLPASPARADPERLALVDARAQLTADPDQGIDLSGAEHGEQWATLQRHYNDLDDTGRSWLAGLISEATRRNVDFHARRTRSLRVFELYRALISLCACGAGNDEIARALLALVAGDVALFPALHVGHVVGSLGAAEASRFASLVDDYTHDRLKSYTDESGSLRYRRLAA